MWLYRFPVRSPLLLCDVRNVTWTILSGLPRPLCLPPAGGIDGSPALSRQWHGGTSPSPECPGHAPWSPVGQPCLPLCQPPFPLSILDHSLFLAFRVSSTFLHAVVQNPRYPHPSPVPKCLQRFGFQTMSLTKKWTPFPHDTPDDVLSNSS